jgi:hypothetical protein
MTTISCNTVTAQKPHTCDYCKECIPVGTKYEVSKHKADGDFYTWKAHTHCIALASKLGWFDDRDKGLTSGDFIEEVQIEFDNINIHENLVASNFAEELGHVLEYHKI